MKTPREEFVAHWLHRLAGMALTGLILDQDERVKGPFGAGARALEIPEKVEKLLIHMFDDAARRLDKPIPVNPTPPSTNGDKGVNAQQGQTSTPRAREEAAGARPVANQAGAGDPRPGRETKAKGGPA
mgnify:CR=1 FL=1